MLKPKIRHILGCLSFSDFFCQKSYSNPVKSHLKNTMGNPFFDMPFSGTNTPIFFRIVIIYDLIQKLLSETILDIRKCPN